VKVLLDTNVVLDVLLEREPFYKTAVTLLTTANNANIDFVVTASTVSDLYYITRKGRGHLIAKAMLKRLFRFVDIALVDKTIIWQALESELPDFEDAIQIGSAKAAGIFTIITRNPSDFQDPAITIYTPEGFLKL